MHKFPCMSEIKILKKDFFVGYQIKQLFHMRTYKNRLNANEKKTCDTFKNTNKTFRIQKRQNYEEIFFLSTYM